MLLADIGNTHIHIFNTDRYNDEVIHLKHNIAIKKYSTKDIYYISVNSEIEEKINASTKWKNISSKINLDGSYDTMGVDRKSLCLSHKNGIFIDAGSAITIDIMESGIYKGGFILAGLKSILNSYKDISPKLEIDMNYDILLDRLPLTTKDGISYGIIAPIKTIIEKHQEDRKLYFTGGDGEYLSSLFENSVFDEKLVFKGMQTRLKGN